MKNSGVPISSFSSKVQDQIIAQLHPNNPRALTSDAPPNPPERDRLRQRKSPLNKTEAEFFAWLRSDGRGEGREILAQHVTLLIGNGCRYTPDFFLTPYVAGNVMACAYEVKGFMRDDSAVKIKVAAKLYTWIRFYLASKRNRSAGGGWQIQEILP